MERKGGREDKGKCKRRTGTSKEKVFILESTGDLGEELAGHESVQGKEQGTQL